MESLNRVEISAEALRHNFNICKKMAGEAGVMAMVKADAYGHGMVDCARVLAAEGAAAFGVAEVVEGVVLRKAGLTLPVFILAGIIPDTVETALHHDLTPVIVDDEAIQALDATAGRLQKRVGVHLKMDAGMGRQGTVPADFRRLVDKVNAAKNLYPAGILAHLPMADAADGRHSAMVLDVFNRCIASVRDDLPATCCCHIANSGGLFTVKDAQLQMVRPGISLYGYYADGESGRAKYSDDELLQPVMRFVSRILQVREVASNSGLGYGHLFTTTRPSKIALIPVGYEDGYLRCLSNKAEVLVRGQRAPVVGRISMNLTMVDVTEIKDVSVGEEVVLLGKSGDAEVNADEIASWMETISYEVLCLFGKMNNRYFIDERRL
ncbi:alanine racemase [Desulfogranum japonicum]|uniref:alanine racemase n=1 Tax=Desulfogranum japonicum TaxID=231447 RepID=UPI0003F5A167|nr:alanine racemase [Desulfogranum japonicum]